jgi:hypothetical protein
MLEGAIPAVGTPYFRELPYKSKLYILSLKMFAPDEYYLRSGQTNTPPTATPTKLFLEYPPAVDLITTDYPVAFLRNYWAGYACRFHPKWYQTKSLTPLEEYGIDHRFMVNLNRFTFPFLSVQKYINPILRWVSRNFYMDRICGDCLIDICKVANYIFLCGIDYEQSTAYHIYEEALSWFCTCATFSEINRVNPVIEDCNELIDLELDNFVAYGKSMYRNERWHYPLIPVGLFAAKGFSISNWGWVDKR